MRGERLSLRLPRIRGEPAHGLIGRLAARHGRGDVGAFASACGLSLRSLLAGRGATMLARLVGIEADGLGHFSPDIDASSRTVRLGGERIALGDWSVSSRRWCCGCLAEDRSAASARGEPESFHMHHRCWWDVRSITSCPRHGTPLRETCASCGRRQGWGGRIDRCGCGTSLLSMVEDRGADRVSDAFLAGRIMGAADPATRLDALGYDDAVRLLDRTGEIEGWSRFRPARPQEERGTIRDRGLDMLSNWPDGFQMALDTVVGEAPPRAGLLARYGWVYEFWIKDLPAEAFGNELRRELRRHAVANGIMAADEVRLGHDPEVATVSATAAAGLLGMGYARARRALDREGLVPVGARRGVTIPVPHSGLASALRRRRATVGLTGLREVFGVGRGQARRVAVAAAIPSVGGRYDGKAASRYVARLRGYACHKDSSAKRTIPLPIACRAVGVPLDVACAAVAEGKLDVAAGPGIGLTGLHVKPADLRELASARGLSIERTAARLGVHHEVARALVRQGHLGSGVGIRGVGADDVERFRSEYVPAAELARSVGTSPRKVLRRLGEMGMRPVIGPPDCRAAFFRRDPAVALAKRIPGGGGPDPATGRRRVS